MTEDKIVRLTGRCLCGSVQYSCESKILFASICYCQDCRRWSGTGHMALIGVPRSNLLIDETRLGQCTVIGGSGKAAVRHFCCSCGSSLFGSPGALPGIATICCGTLDDPDVFVPQVAVCIADRPGWSRLAVACPEFAAMPVGKIPQVQP